MYVGTLGWAGCVSTHALASRRPGAKPFPALAKVIVTHFTRDSLMCLMFVLRLVSD